MIIIIAYKLNNPSKDYMPLYTSIKSLASNWWRSFDSLWLIHTNLSPIEIKESLVSNLDSKDEIIVARVDGEITGYISAELHDWLKNN